MISFKAAAVLSILASLPLLAQEPYASAGALQHEGQWEVSVKFHVPVDPLSARNLDNYSLPGAEIESIRFVPEANAIILTTAGLDAGNFYSVAMNGIEDSSGGTLPQLALSFETGPFHWTEVGAAELGLPADAVAVGPDGFDLVSAGFQMWSTYDETTFVYQRVTGNFDVAVRLIHQDPTSSYARAGLMVRETLDTGKPRPADPFDPAQAFSRYIDVHANPVTTAEGFPANNLYEVNVRYYTGGIGSPNFDATENPPLQNNAPPAYPNAWLRIQRSGQTFTTYRSTDGAEWIELGSFTFPTEDASGNPVPPFPAAVFVGPHYSPETGEIPGNSGLRDTFLAQFRDYSIEALANPASGLTIRKTGASIEIFWEGTAILQRTDSLVNPNWTDIPEAFPPYNTAPSGDYAFYRLKQL